METIGKNRVESLKQLRAKTGEFYIPDPTASMSCDELNGRYLQLSDQILFWNDQITKLKFKILSGDKKESENISAIMEIQAAVMAKYEQELLRCNVDTGGGGGGGGNGNGNGGPGGDPGTGQPGTDPGTGIMEWIKKNPVITAGAAIVLVMLLKNSKIAGSGNQGGLMFVAAAVAIVALSKKKTNDIPALITEIVQE